MGQPVVHWELWSKEPEKLSKFYQQAFDWKVTFHQEMSYRIVETGGDGGINGGIFTPDRSGPWPGNMSMYIQVDDLEAHAKKIEAAGGKIVVARQEVPGMGAFSLFEDPDGRVMGCWEVRTAQRTE
jgi:predicted enzyme related to lactoylglutathione lyase